VHLNVRTRWRVHSRDTLLLYGLQPSAACAHTLVRLPSCSAHSTQWCLARSQQLLCDSFKGGASEESAHLSCVTAVSCRNPSNSSGWFQKQPATWSACDTHKHRRTGGGQHVCARALQMTWHTSAGGALLRSHRAIQPNTELCCAGALCLALLVCLSGTSTWSTRAGVCVCVGGGGGCRGGTGQK
jgi:hypothetical protein